MAGHNGSECRPVTYFLKVDGKVEHVVRNGYLDRDGQFQWPKILPEEFLSIEEMADDLLERRLSKEDVAAMKATPRADLPLYHHGFGTSIRNSYGIWHPAHPLTDPKDLGDKHPDGVSMKVIERLWEKVQASQESPASAGQ